MSSQIKMSEELKQLLGTDDIVYRNLNEEPKIMSVQDKFDKIRNVINNTIPRSEMSAELKQLLGTDDIVYRNLDEEHKIMSIQDKFDKIKYML